MNLMSDAIVFNESRTTATFLVKKSIYSKPAILRACYWMNRDMHFRIDEGTDTFHITATLQNTVPTLAEPRPKTFDELLPIFFDTLNDSQLRVDIQAETAQVRELIIAKAFAESGVLEDPPPGTFDDPVDSKKTNLINISFSESN
jgi:His-Xaa-Ser system protein HxsD